METPQWHGLYLQLLVKWDPTMRSLQLPCPWMQYPDFFWWVLLGNPCLEGIVCKSDMPWEFNIFYDIPIIISIQKSAKLRDTVWEETLNLESEGYEDSTSDDVGLKGKTRYFVREMFTTVKYIVCCYNFTFNTPLVPTR